MTNNSAVDTGAAKAYERFLAGPLNSDMATHLVRLAALRPGSRFLDVACGTGILLRKGASQVAPGGIAVGLDSDPGMIAAAQSMVERPGDVTFEWHCASAQDMPIESGTMDAVFCLQGLQYFPDSAACLAEIRRILKPDGLFFGGVWTSLDSCKGQLAIAEALDRRHIDTSAIVKAYSFGDPERIRAIAAVAGLRVLYLNIRGFSAIFPSIPGFITAFSEGSLSSRAAMARVQEADRDDFVADIERSLQRYLGKSGLAFPVECLVVILRK